MLIFFFVVVAQFVYFRVFILFLYSFPYLKLEKFGLCVYQWIKYPLQYCHCSVVVDVSGDEDHHRITEIKAKLSTPQNVCIVLTNSKYSPIVFLFNVILQGFHKKLWDGQCHQIQGIIDIMIRPICKFCWSHSSLFIQHS